jgi:MYXO-CTERM domain-containing protein
MKVALGLRAALLIAVPLIFSSSAAFAANIVLNPGFETGDFTDWTEHTCTTGCSVQGVSVDPGGAHSGTFAAESACVGVACLNPSTGDWISQILATTASTAYTFSFWMSPGTDAGNATVEADVYWNGTEVGAFVSEPAGYSQFTIGGLVATGASTTLEITLRHDPATIFVDDVCVSSSTDCGSVSGVPEPYTFALTGFGLAGLGLIRGLRRRNT